MLRYDHSKSILEGLFDRKFVEGYVPEEESDPSEWKYASKPIKFPIDNSVNEEAARIYIGLFTTAPLKNGEGEGYVEPGPTPESESGPRTTWPEYSRIRLNTKSRLKRVEFLSGAQVKNNAAGTAEMAYVENDDMILFPEAIGNSDDGWGTIVGFGLFYSKTGGQPFLWGDIQADNGQKGVPVPAGHVPVIRESGLQISLE